MAPPSQDLARWIGYGGAVHQATGTDLVPGETIVAVPRDEAELSEHWQPVDANGKPLKPKRSRTAPSESAGTGEAAGAPSEQDGSAD